MDKETLIREIAARHHMILGAHDPVFAELELHGLLYAELQAGIAHCVEEAAARMEGAVGTCIDEAQGASDAWWVQFTAQAETHLKGVLDRVQAAHLQHLQAEHERHEKSLCDYHTILAGQIETAGQIRGELRAWTFYGGLAVGGLSVLGFIVIALQLAGKL